MDATYSQKQEMLKKRGITPDTKHHDYDYLYKSIITAMEEYHKVKSKEEAQGRYEKACNLIGDVSTPAQFMKLIDKQLRIAAGIEEKEEPLNTTKGICDRPIEDPENPQWDTDW